MNKNGRKRDLEAIERRKYYWRSYRECRNEKENERNTNTMKIKKGDGAHQ